MNDQGVLFKIYVSTDGKITYQIFMEGDLLEKTIINVHEDTGHGGTKVVTELLRNKIFFSGLRYKIKEMLKKCVNCINIMFQEH